MSDTYCEQSGLLIINDSNAEKHCPSEGMTIDGRVMSTGLIGPSDYTGSAVCEPWPYEDIPEDEWEGRIDEYREQKRSVFHFYDRYNAPCLDQNGTNYCHTNALVQCAMAMLMKQGHGYIPLSPASVAAPMLGYRNVGSLGREALEYAAEHGIAETKFWPNNAIDRKYDNEQSRASRVKFVPKKFYILPHRFAAKMTALLMGLELACGYRYWSHEIMAAAPWYKKQGNRIIYGSEEMNSWTMNWPAPGAKGRCVLERNKSGDLIDCVTIAQMAPVFI